MANASKLTIDEVDATFSPNNPKTGVICFMGQTKRGPVGNPDMLITGFTMFKKIYGGYLSGTSDFPLLAEHAFTGGAQLRVNRAAHYTDITDDTTLDMVTAELNPKITKLTFAGAFVSANVINLTVSGVAISPVTYATSSDNTLGLIAAAIDAITTVDSATVIVAGGGNRTIIVVHNDDEPTITSIVVTLGASQTAGTATSCGNYIGDGKGNPIALFAPKYPGADYNYLTVEVANASNGNANYFNIIITHSVDTYLYEKYENLTITGNPAISASDYLKTIQDNSSLVDITYADLSGTTGQINPSRLTYTMILGDDGGAIVAADYAGDATEKTGVYKFNSVTDSMVLMIPEMDDATIHTAVEEYVESRKDMVYVAYQNLSSSNPSTWTTQRGTQALDSSYIQLVGGNIQVLDPSTLTKRYVSPLGEVAGAIARTHSKMGAWRAYTNPTYGAFKKALAVEVNFGSPADYNDLNLLANNQICMVVSRDGKIFLTGNFTAQLANSKVSFASIRFLSIYLKNSLKPILQKFVDEEVPLDLITFKDIYNSVVPTIKNLTSETNRAIYPGEGQGWRWDGDQDVATIDDVQVNNTVDLDAGKYKALLYYKPINSLRELELTLTLTATNVSLD